MSPYSARLFGPAQPCFFGPDGDGDGDKGRDGLHYYRTNE